MPWLELISKYATMYSCFPVYNYTHIRSIVDTTLSDSPYDGRGERRAWMPDDTAELPYQNQLSTDFFHMT